jgi:hypothetical protein
MGMDNKTAKSNTPTSTARWFQEMDGLNTEPFLFDRVQPATTKREIFDERCLDDECEG